MSTPRCWLLGFVWACLLIVLPTGFAWPDDDARRRSSPRPPSVKPDALKIKLVHRIRLDRNLEASEPDDDSKIGPAPPEVIAARVIPPFIVDDDEVTFLAPDGAVTRRIRLRDDPKLHRSVILSPNEEALAVGTTFSAEVNSGEKAEGGEWPETITVYARSGEPMYTTTQGSDDSIHLSDSGAAVATNFHTGEITFIDRRTGADRKTIRYLGPYGSGRPRVAVNRGGDRVLIVAPSITLDGDRRGNVITANVQDLVRRGVQEVWASLHDDAGNELWRKKVPRLVSLHAGVALADDASRAYIHGRMPPEEAEPGRMGNFGVMLDGTGEVVGTSTSWGYGMDQTRFRADLGGFSLGPPDSSHFILLRPDGSTQAVFDAIHNHPVLKEFFFLHKAVTPRLVAALVHTRKGSRLVLVLMDLLGNILLTRNVGGAPRHRRDDDDEGEGPDDGPTVHEDSMKGRAGNFTRIGVSLSPDAAWVAVRLPREVRVFKILEHDARGRGGRR